jgi:hypothetical protein
LILPIWNTTPSTPVRISKRPCVNSRYSHRPCACIIKLFQYSPQITFLTLTYPLLPFFSLAITHRSYPFYPSYLSHSTPPFRPARLVRSTRFISHLSLQTSWAISGSESTFSHYLFVRFLPSIRSRLSNPGPKYLFVSVCHLPSLLIIQLLSHRGELLRLGFLFASVTRCVNRR